MILAWCHTLIIIVDYENSFHLFGAIQDSFQFDSPEAINSKLFILSFQLSFSKSYRRIIQVFSYQLVIYSFTCIKNLSSIFICFLVLPGELCLCYFHFQFLRRFVQEFSSLVIISIHSFFPILPADRWRFFSSLAMSLLILSTRISCMQSVACHQSKLVKDTRNIILILVHPSD